MPTLFRLDQACFPEPIAYSLQELASFVHHPSSFTVVACSGLTDELCSDMTDSELATPEVIVGFAIVRPIRRRKRTLRTHALLHVITIDVGPEFRRRGVGTLLMRWICEKAQELASKSIVLEVACDNLPAQRFYARHGFEPTGLIPGYYNGVVDALSMERPLGPASDEKGC